jgi:hypothetical protein
MSITNECKAGVNDIIYFIDNCCAELVTDENGIYDEEKSLEYLIGDKVCYLDWYNKTVGDNIFTMIKFKDEKGRINSAVESYFVTEDVWDGLRNYFSASFDNDKGF